MTKPELRKQIKEILVQQKNSLSKLSESICQNILNSDHYKSADTILAYMALADEVDLQSVIENAIEEGKKLYLPKVDPKSTSMEFYRYNHNNRTITGAFGIQEPDETIPFQLKPESKVLVLVPGRGFSKTGARLGRGKAYYDTYFSQIHQKLTMAGICFECQIIQDLPVESHDIFMDLVITEKGIIKQ